MRGRLDFAGVNAAALAALPAVLTRLLPRGKIDGREFVALNPRRNDSRLGSFKIRLSGARAGSWADFATGDKGGDFISLVAYLNGVSQRNAALMLAARLGINPYQRADAIQPKPTSAPAPKQDDGGMNIVIASRIWEAGGSVLGSPGEDYLRGPDRRIDTDAIADILANDHAIRWNPSVLFRQPGHDLHGKRIGAIVCQFTDLVTGEPIGGISRTYIRKGQKIGKAKSLGSTGGVIRLSPDDDVLGGLHLAEGLETALTEMSFGFRPLWATGGTGRMHAFPVLCRHRASHTDRGQRPERSRL